MRSLLAQGASLDHQDELHGEIRVVILSFLCLPLLIELCMLSILPCLKLKFWARASFSLHLILLACFSLHLVLLACVSLHLILLDCFFLQLILLDFQVTLRYTRPPGRGSVGR